MIKLKRVHVALSRITRLQGNTVQRLTHSSLVCFEIRSHCVPQATWAWNWCSLCLRITECGDYSCGNLHRLSSFLSPSRLWGEHQLKLPAINGQRGEVRVTDENGRAVFWPAHHCIQVVTSTWETPTDFMCSPRVSDFPSYKCGKSLVIKVYYWGWRWLSC